MGKHLGFTMIETLMAMLISLCIIHVTSIMFCGLQNINLVNNTDIPYALYSLSEEISTALSVDVASNQITISHQEGDYTFSLHNNRLVRQPGFNIYLHEIDYLYFYHDKFYVYMTLHRGGVNEKFKIGVYYRPEKRICELNDSSDSSCNDEYVELFNNFNS